MNDQNVRELADEGEISLIEIGIALGEQKRLLLGIPALTTAIALGFALFTTPIYTARTIILPPQQQQSEASSALASLGTLAGIAGAAVGVRSPEDMYVAFFKSRSVEDDVIKRLNLQQHYKAQSKYDARLELERSVSASADKQTGLITINANDKDPTFAALLANTEVVALRDLLSRIAVTGAQQRRLFFGEQIRKTEQALAAADARFRTLSAQGGLPIAEALAQSDVQTSIVLRAKITSTEVALAAAQQFTTPENPNVQHLTNQLTALREQLDKLQQGGTSMLSTTRRGEAAISALRTLKTQEAILDVMTRQYETAKVDEAREGPILQQVDLAQVPEKKSKPRRILIVLIGAAIGLFFGIISALSRQALQKAKNDPTKRERLSFLKNTWRNKT